MEGKGQETTEALAFLERAWCIMAAAGAGPSNNGWGGLPLEWKQTAAQWRDEYQNWLVAIGVRDWGDL